jgi:hypothetical protein
VSPPGLARLCPPLLALLAAVGCGEDPAKPEFVWGRRGVQDGDLVRPRAAAIDLQDRLYLVDFTARIQVYDRDGHTDIAAALKLALASFADDSGKRIVLISDGNENLGDAEEQARLARTLAVQIDVLPLAAGQVTEDEVLVERVEAPPVIEQGARVPVRVLVRSDNPHVVVGRLTLSQVVEGQKAPAAETVRVRLRRGLNTFSFTRAPPEQEPGDFAARLLRAKKKVWEERKKDGGAG